MLDQASQTSNKVPAFLLDLTKNQDPIGLDPFEMEPGLHSGGGSFEKKTHGSIQGNFRGQRVRALFGASVDSVGFLRSAYLCIF